MNAWVCNACGATDGLRTVDDACEHCGGKVIYKAVADAQVYVIGETTIEVINSDAFKREKPDASDTCGIKREKGK